VSKLKRKSKKSYFQICKGSLPRKNKKEPKKESKKELKKKDPGHIAGSFFSFFGGGISFFFDSFGFFLI